MLKTMRKLLRRRKAISPVISAILLIALTVVSVSIVYFLIVPYLNKTNIYASVIKIKDTDKDSRYDQLKVYLANSGTKELEITEIIVWTVPENLRGDQNSYVSHTNWTFKYIQDATVYPNEFTEALISSPNQIELTFLEETFYRLEITYSGQQTHYFSDWRLLNDQADFADLVSDFVDFDLQAWGFEGTIDVPGWPSNNYHTLGGPEHGPLIEGQYIYLPVIDESTYVRFYVTGKIVIFHSINGNLTIQPTMQQINKTEDPFKGRKLFLLGLAGSWGDEFPNGATALTLNITYTDGSSSIWDLGHDYIDDWWYNSNNGHKCVSAPGGKITEIDLGIQVDSPDQPIHTHTAGFVLDFYKYVQFITFTDPGNDQSGPHLLSLTVG
ncbi:MAG TPA: type IV pilin [candidate division Zixibacteria bacterium]|nr:type IV pilin [candidate division Zixibacteria bacterium]